MNKEHDISTSLIIHATPAAIWQAFVNPEIFKQWMYGATVISDWKEGSSITYRGEWEGKTFEDKGVIQKIEPEHLLMTSYYSPLSEQPDTPENYQMVTYLIDQLDDGECTVTISQSNNKTKEAGEAAIKNWNASLQTIKKLLEK
ncbi:MAG TPA: SRPBCC domain-containing protein [Candidatus Saccharimonadales bacterium]|nr:SRPBCC domain-containing protein [Candidatus Saccharimonadales bacterium]